MYKQKLQENENKRWNNYELEMEINMKEKIENYVPCQRKDYII